MMYGYPSGDLAATISAVFVCILVVGYVLIDWYGDDQE